MGATEQKKELPPVLVTGKIIRETVAAILIEVEGTGIWFPLSQVHEIHRSPDLPYESTVLVAHWIAHTRGLC